MAPVQASKQPHLGRSSSTWLLWPIVAVLLVALTIYQDTFGEDLLSIKAQHLAFLSTSPVQKLPELSNYTTLLRRVDDAQQVYKDAETKGQIYMAWLCNPKTMPQSGIPERSPFDTYHDMAKWGWFLDDYYNPEPDERPPDKASIGDETGVMYKWFNKYDVNPDGEGPYKKTEAWFHNAFWPSHGVIYAGDNKSPGQEVKEKLESHDWNKNDKFTKLRNWSDVMFLTYAKLCGSTDPSKTKDDVNNCLRNIRRVYRDLVVNFDTVRIMETVLKNMPGGTYPLGHAPPWPGVTVKKGEPGFLALLGSPNVYGVAFLLAQHADEFGPKDISAITLYNCADDPEKSYNEALMVQIVDGQAPQSG